MNFRKLSRKHADIGLPGGRFKEFNYDAGNLELFTL